MRTCRRADELTGCQGRFLNLVRPERCLIMLRRGATGGKLRIIVDWTEELKQILASGGER